jgi:circadian clock protein KaiB
MTINNFDPIASNLPPHLLKLFITKWSTASHRAVKNLTEVIKDHYPLTYRLEVIDISQQPLIAIAENITAVPLLLRELPEPTKRMVGDMSDRLKVVAGLKISPQ